VRQAFAQSSSSPRPWDGKKQQEKARGARLLQDYLWRSPPTPDWLRRPHDFCRLTGRRSLREGIILVGSQFR